MARIKLKKKTQKQRRLKFKKGRDRTPLPADIQFASVVYAPPAKVLKHRCLGGEVNWVFMWKIRCYLCGLLFTTDKNDNPEITWEELLEKRRSEKPKELAGFAREVKRYCDGIIHRGGHPDLQVAEGSLGKVLVCSDGTIFTRKRQ